MITILNEALAFIENKKSPIFIDIPHAVSGCCFEITDCPSVNFGEPKNLLAYSMQTIQGVAVYVPCCFPKDDPLTIRIKSFLGLKRLVLGGWRLT